MKYSSHRDRVTTNRVTTSRGFTLIEVIITLTVAALLMAVVLPYLGTSLLRSSEPLINLQNTLAIYQTMENMTADYRNLKTTKSLDLAAFQNGIGGEGTDVNNTYGGYHVVENRFIIFDGSDQETTAGTEQHTLKVTVRPQVPGASFTTLFTSELP
jgi:prepilin-type N-terminal cleavage/methylation domain-containing protein